MSFVAIKNEVIVNIINNKTKPGINIFDINVNLLNQFIFSILGIINIHINDSIIEIRLLTKPLVIFLYIDSIWLDLSRTTSVLDEFNPIKSVNELNKKPANTAFTVIKLKCMLALSFPDRISILIILTFIAIKKSNDSNSRTMYFLFFNRFIQNPPFIKVIYMTFPKLIKLSLLNVYAALILKNASVAISSNGKVTNKPLSTLVVGISILDE